MQPPQLNILYATGDKSRGTMQSTARIVLSICVLVSAVTTVSSSSAKLRRDGVLNLYPFPRVGRAHHTWQVPVNDQYLDSELASKRQLYAFPRVGRGDFGYVDQSNLNRINLRLEELLLGQQLLDHPRSNDYVKRESESTSSGMWFGPRVGRSFNNDDIINREEDKDSDSEESAERIERKKRQTKRA